MSYHPGTIVAFSGNWFTPRFPWLSATAIGIQVRTMSRWSHVGIIARITWRDVEATANRIGVSDDRLKWLMDNPPGTVLLESTMLARGACLVTGKPIKGVQCRLPGNRIASYSGRVATLKPRTPLTEDQRAKLASLALDWVGTPYDGMGVARLGTYAWKYLRGWRMRDRSSMFCSELVAQACRELRLTDVNTDPPKPGYASPGAVVDYHARFTHGEPKRET